MPLPTPHCLWSHLALDFITHLPESNGNTIILVVLHRFSLSLHLIQACQPDLPSAFNLKEVMFNHVFYYFGLPEYVVSDRGPQFISQVWNCFLLKLGATISLISGYHPRFNGQVGRV